MLLLCRISDLETAIRLAMSKDKNETSSGDQPTDDHQHIAALSRDIHTFVEDERARQQQRDTSDERRFKWERLTASLIGAYTLITAGTLWVTREQEHRQLRAYIGAQKSKGASPITANCQYCGIIDPAQQAQNNLIVLVKNFGLTPAYRPTNCFPPISVRVGQPFNAVDALKTIEKQCGARISTPTIWPQEERSYVSPMTDAHIELFKSVSAKEIDLYLVGLITYYDAFGDPHKTYLCYKYLLVNGLQAWESCPGSFGADD